MVLRVLPCLLCAATLVAGVQDPSPAPQPPSAPGLPPPAVPSTQPAPSSGADLTALKAQLDDLQIRLRQQQEDGILRLGELKAAQAELRAALADLARQLALLEALPAQIKLIGDQAKAGADRGAALDLQQAAQLQARLEGERGALQALLDPNGTPLDAEALAAKAPAAYKPLLDAIPAGLSAANRDTLVLLIATRNELQVLLLAQRLLLSRMLGAASSIAATFAPFRQEPALAALDALIKSAEESRAKLKTLLAAPEPRDLAILEAATYR